MTEVRSDKPSIRFKSSQVMEHLRRHHPNCPAKTMKLIAYRTSVQSWSGVSLGRAVGIVIDGFLRHERTQYERLLMDGVDREEARRLVKPKMMKILSKWATTSEEQLP